MANILWIEDEANRIGGLVKPLKKAGHNIIVAEDKQEAFRKINDLLTTLRLIIVDIIIPSGSAHTNQEEFELDDYEGIKVLEYLTQKK